jgi:hypothetical protein
MIISAIIIPCILFIAFYIWACKFEKDGFDFLFNNKNKNK